VRRVAASVVVLALAGCTFAQKHPGVTVGIASGTVGFFACEVSVGKVGTCAAVGGGAGLALGLITGLVMLAVGDNNAHQITDDEPPPQPIDTTTAPPPGLPADGGLPVPPPDAGVISQPDA